jgi:uncharacterized membrane protein SpoIIM required for sporulation
MAHPPLPQASAASETGTPVADVDRFVEGRVEDWKRLAVLLERVETQGSKGLSLTEVRTLGRLYRATCADLLIARGELADARLSDYLEVLVGRAYGVVYARAPRLGSRALAFLWSEFPPLVRAEQRLVWLAALCLLLGALFGALVMVTDPAALAVVVPDMHLDQTPSERIQAESFVSGHDAGRSVVFSSFLFTHNIQVTFLVFALGVTFGLGTAAALFWNGIPLGALAAQYHQSGEALFFWAWILPHGVIELSVVFIAGASGFVLARGLWLPGRLPRVGALALEARVAVQLVLGCMPLLVIAGLVEGTLSQMHAPTVPYWVKLVFAGGLFLALVAYLQRGRRSAVSQ